MFWKFNMSSPHIETLLNKEDLTLQEVMDEEDVLEECKVQNKKLIDFLARPEVIEELVTLITVEPSSDVEERDRYRYPNKACDLLTCDVPTLNERLAGNEALLGKLYGFLEGDPPLNPLLASFFSKTVSVLVTRKSEQNWYSYQFTCLQVLEFLKAKEEFISLLLKHLGTSAIMDLLLKLITGVEGSETRQNVLNWLDSQNIVQQLVGLLNPSVDSERHCNASQLLCDVIRLSRENVISNTERCDPDPILKSLEAPETVAQLLNHALNGEKKESCITGAISVLLTLLEEHRPNMSDHQDNMSNCPNEQHMSDSEKPSREVQTTVSAILPRLKDFHSLLLEPPPKEPINSTMGILDPPLGLTRVQVAKLISALVATSIPAVQNSLADLGTIDVLLDLFFKYTWNNFLHTQVEHCIGNILNSVPVELAGDAKPSQENLLIVHLFQKCRIVQRLLEAWEDNETQQSKPGGYRRGYMGHLIKIANHIADQSQGGSNCDIVKEQLTQLPEDVHNQWENFVNVTLANVNVSHRIALGGTYPSYSNADNTEYREVQFPQESSPQQVFSDYQMQQMAPSFIEHFGYHNDQFTEVEDLVRSSVSRMTGFSFGLSDEDVERQAEIFHQVCSQRTSSLGEDSEAIWANKEAEMSYRPSLSQADADDDDAGENSSSDEDDRAGGQGEVRMEVDSTDPWSAIDTSEPAPVAMDTTVNPWDGSGTPAEASTEQGWADFGSASFNGVGFADFSSSFEDSKLSSVDLNSEEKPPRNVSEQKTSETKPSQPSESALEKGDCKPNAEALETSDDNANPSSQGPPADEDNELMDNFRFLSSQGLMTSKAGGEEAQKPEEGEDKPKENGPVDSSMEEKKPEESIVKVTETLVAHDSVPVSAPEASPVAPNGPV